MINDLRVAICEVIKCLKAGRNLQAKTTQEITEKHKQITASGNRLIEGRSKNISWLRNNLALRHTEVYSFTQIKL